MELDPCGRYLLTCFSDATLRLYDLKPRKTSDKPVSPPNLSSLKQGPPVV